MRRTPWTLLVAAILAAPLSCYGEAGVTQNVTGSISGFLGVPLEASLEAEVWLSNWITITDGATTYTVPGGKSFKRTVTLTDPADLDLYLEPNITGGAYTVSPSGTYWTFEIVSDLGRFSPRLQVTAGTDGQFGDMVIEEATTSATAPLIRTGDTATGRIIFAGGDGAIAIPVDATEPSSPVNGDLWNDSGTLKIYTGSSWEPLSTSGLTASLPLLMSSTSNVSINVDNSPGSALTISSGVLGVDSQNVTASYNNLTDVPATFTAAPHGATHGATSTDAVSLLTQQISDLPGALEAGGSHQLDLAGLTSPLHGATHGATGTDPVSLLGQQISDLEDAVEAVVDLPDLQGLIGWAQIDQTGSDLADLATARIQDLTSFDLNGNALTDGDGVLDITGNTTISGDLTISGGDLYLGGSTISDADGIALNLRGSGNVTVTGSVTVDGDLHSGGAILAGEATTAGSEALAVITKGYADSAYGASGHSPIAHAASHESGGGDPITHDNLTGAGSNSHAQIDSHIADTANPHATDIGNLGSGTLAELNAAITDATLYDGAHTTARGVNVPLALDGNNVSQTYAGAGFVLDGSSRFTLNYAPSGTSLADRPVAADDSRLSDSRTPTAHGSSHTDGTDNLSVGTGIAISGGSLILDEAAAEGVLDLADLQEKNHTSLDLVSKDDHHTVYGQILKFAYVAGSVPQVYMDTASVTTAANLSITLSQVSDLSGDTGNTSGTGVANAVGSQTGEFSLSDHTHLTNLEAFSDAVNIGPIAGLRILGGGTFTKVGNLGVLDLSAVGGGFSGNVTGDTTDGYLSNTVIDTSWSMNGDADISWTRNAADDATLSVGSITLDLDDDDTAALVKLTVPDLSGSGEVWQEWAVSGSSGGFAQVVNQNSTDNVASTTLRLVSGGASTASPILNFRVPVSEDTGTTPAAVIDVEQADNTALVNRPLLAIQSGTGSNVLVQWQADGEYRIVDHIHRLDDTTSGLELEGSGTVQLVSGGTNAVAISSTSMVLNAPDDTDTLIRISTTDGQMDFENQGSTTLTLDSGNQVGINDSTPDHVLDVEGGALANGEWAGYFAGTVADTAHDSVLRISATFDATTGAAGNGMRIITTGTAGTSRYIGMSIAGGHQGTGTSWEEGTSGNYAAYYDMTTTSAGSNMAFYAHARGSSDFNIGAYGQAGFGAATAGDNVGFGGAADVADSADAAGVLAFLDSGTISAYDLTVTAALVADNRDESASIAAFLDNGTEVITIADGGDLQVSTTVHLADTAGVIGLDADGSGNWDITVTVTETQADSDYIPQLTARTDPGGAGAYWWVDNIGTGSFQAHVRGATASQWFAMGWTVHDHN